MRKKKNRIMEIAGLRHRSDLLLEEEEDDLFGGDDEGDDEGGDEEAELISGEMHTDSSGLDPAEPQVA